MNPKTVIFTGSQGSGKGTQAALLMNYLEEQHGDVPTKEVETGTFFRELIKGQGFTNDLVRDTLNKGSIQPDFLATLIVGNAFMQLDGNEHIVVDGYPRTQIQSWLFDEILRFYKRERPVFINLVIKEEDAIARIKERGRDDDSEQAIKERFAWYHDKVVPALDYFRNNEYYSFVDVDGSQPIEVIHSTVVKSIFT